MRARVMGMRVSFSLRVALPMPMLVGVRRAGLVPLGLRYAVAAEVVMVMTMRRRRQRGRRNPPLLTDLRLLGRLVIVLVAPSLGVRREPP